MSSSFYITPYDPRAWEDSDDTSPKPTSDLRIDLQAYREGLLQRWRGITIYGANPSPFPLNWELPPETKEYSGVQGHLHDDQQVVSFYSAPKRSFVDFILWHRSFISDKYELYLFNSSSWDSLLLTEDTTEQDIADFTGIVG